MRENNEYVDLTTFDLIVVDYLPLLHAEENIAREWMHHLSMLPSSSQSGNTVGSFAADLCADSNTAKFVDDMHIVLFLLQLFLNFGVFADGVLSRSLY